MIEENGEDLTSPDCNPTAPRPSPKVRTVEEVFGDIQGRPVYLEDAVFKGLRPACMATLPSARRR